MAAPFRVGEELELRIDSLAFGGRGVGRVNGVVVFVARALPGDLVRARVTKVKRRHAEGVAVETLERGPDRVEAPCPHFGPCGGCRWQDLAYERQLEHKAAQVRDALERIGHLSGFELEPIAGAVKQFGYRNKLEYAWTRSDDGPALGFHAAGRWDEIIPLSVCLLTTDARQRACARRSCAGRASSRSSPTTRREQAGYLRHLVVREGIRTGEHFCILVTAPGDLPELERLEALLAEGAPSVVGVMHAVNDGLAEVTGGLPTRPRDRPRVVRGGDPRPAPARLGRVVPADQHRDDRPALPGRRGAGRPSAAARSSGTSTAASARSRSRWPAPRTASSASRSSRRRSCARARTRSLNGVANVEFVAGDAARAPKELLERGLPAPGRGRRRPAARRPDAARPSSASSSSRPSGSSTSRATRRRWPATAQLLAEAGYTLERVKPFDLFPHTPHVECVARFTR